jgi:hypothetical protein
MLKSGMKRFILTISRDRFKFIAFILTIPSGIIWLSGMVSYIWALISKYFLLKLPPWGAFFILLIIPFIAFISGVISYLKSKSSIAKWLLLTNLFFILLTIISSILLT